jgi:hypothetical protein
VLVEWNVTRKGVPVPANFDGLRKSGFKFVRMLVMEWMQVSAGASPPLSQQSGDGLSQEIEAGLSMVPLEASP